MSTFIDRWGGLTAGDLQKLNEAAKWFCECEITAVGGE